MTRVIRARIEGGQIIPEEPLPDASEIRSLYIVLELEDVSGTEADERRSAFDRLRGILKNVDDPKAEYVRILEEKYR